ncbi:tonB family protein [Sorangium cellulosum So ce56]|uniref:TonB family protein n=2 Tax=Sorangium cellulosum TaxID=56 RepID=A9FPP9_SORC5|nr:tonB family protein [Sorangium cellulosum So ce56]
MTPTALSPVTRSATSTREPQDFCCRFLFEPTSALPAIYGRDGAVVQRDLGEARGARPERRVGTFCLSVPPRLSMVSGAPMEEPEHSDLRRRRTRGSAAVAVAAATGALVAFTDGEATAAPAQEPALAEATQGARVTMPSPLGPTEAPYPPGGVGDATVVARITVYADGTVGAVEVEGEEPFASAAARAAPSWRFEPARRDGRPIGARILFPVRFRDPRAAAPAAPPAAPAGPAPPRGSIATAPPSPPAAAQAIDVVVVGERGAPMTTSMTREEVRQVPGAFGDPFRAIEAMPGVTPIASGVPYFFVRGAPPGNVGYFIDGVRVPLLYHVALGPSVIHPALVERVDLYPGGFPARFGRYTGGVIAGETREPARLLHGEANLRLFDAGALVEAPWADGRGTALVGGRYAYPGALLALFSPGVELGYWDYQARVTYDASPYDRVGLFAFGSHDYLAQIEDDGDTDVVLAGDFHRLDLRYDRFFARGGRLRHAITLGHEESENQDGERAGRARLLGARVELSAPVSERLTARAGVDAQLERFDIDIRENDGDFPTRNDRALARLFTSREDLAAGLWADVVVRAAPGFEVVPGLRGDLFASGGATRATVDPRLATRLQATPRVALLSAFGVTHQPPSFLGAVPGMQVGGLRGGVQTGLLASAGVELRLPGEIKATITGFRSGFFDLSDALGNRPPGTDAGLAQRAELRGAGSAHGLEIHAHRSLSKRIGGFVSYTLSRSIRHVGRESFDSAFDRRHVLNMAAAVDVGRGWKLGGRAVFYSGIPMTVDYNLWDNDGVDGQRPDGNDDRPDTEQDIRRRERLRERIAQVVRRLSLPERLPAFFRLDLRLEKRWILRKGRTVSLTVEVLNATAGKETLQYECSLLRGCEPETLGPITLPSIGAEATF